MQYLAENVYCAVTVFAPLPFTTHRPCCCSHQTRRVKVQDSSNCAVYAHTIIQQKERKEECWTNDHPVVHLARRLRFREPQMRTYRKSSSLSCKLERINFAHTYFYPAIRYLRLGGGGRGNDGFSQAHFSSGWWHGIEATFSGWWIINMFFASSWHGEASESEENQWFCGILLILFCMDGWIDGVGGWASSSLAFKMIFYAKIERNYKNCRSFIWNLWIVIN